MVFNRKEYMRAYFCQYRQNPEVKEKRKEEAKKNYKRQKSKLLILKKEEKTKQEELNSPKHFLKYVRKDQDIKRYRESSKEQKKTKHSRFTDILDSCDYGLMLVLSRQNNLQISEISEIIGLSRFNLQKHLNRMERLGFVFSSTEVQGISVKRRWTRIYNLTAQGSVLLNLFGTQIKNFILEDKLKREQTEGNGETRKMLLEVLENEQY